MILGYPRGLLKEETLKTIDGLKYEASEWMDWGANHADDAAAVLLVGAVLVGIRFLQEKLDKKGQQDCIV